MNLRTDSTQNDSQHARLWFAAWLGAKAQCELVDAMEIVDPRARFDGDHFYLPQQCLDHHRAATAHFYAHRRFGGVPFSTGSLRPIQIVLASLFEDARVEQLALRERAGLRRLWQPGIATLDTCGDDIPALLRKLTRALFDPGWPQKNPWVEKARRLFLSRRDEWTNPLLSRELGNRLGNDLGQMRLQFNWKSYAVEPAYRDDHRGLWIDDDEPTPRDEQRSAVRLDETATAIAAAPVAGDTHARRSDVGEWLTAAALPVAAAMKLPEWDYARQFYRNDWVSVREQRGAASHADALRIAALTNGLPTPVSARLPPLRRHRRAHDGDSFDIDACIRLAADRRLGADIDTRIYRVCEDRHLPRAILLLIDTSLSMAQRWEKEGIDSASTLMDRAKIVAAKIAQRECSNRVAIFGFSSDGRHALYMTPVKHFSESDRDVLWLSKLAALTTGYSTRLGGALRYARRQFDNEKNIEREIIVIGDGEVSDIDSNDPQYLREDAARAVQELSSEGIKMHYCNIMDVEISYDI